MNSAIKTIYDFGANNGDDIPYYLLKADQVIAVEANPELCDTMRSRFASEINEGRLIVENCVVTDGDTAGDVRFFIHKSNHVLSQFVEPLESQKGQFREIRLSSKPVQRLILQHGVPHFVKIDIECYDAPILRALFLHNIFPPYVSAESHTIEAFAILVATGLYKAFKLVDGISVPSVYRDRIIVDQLGNSHRHSFPGHSAGPFGQDVDGEWMNADQFSRLLTFEGLGWKDIHASRVDEPSTTACVSGASFVRKQCIRKLRESVPYRACEKLFHKVRKFD